MCYILWVQRGEGKSKSGEVIEEDIWDKVMFKDFDDWSKMYENIFFCFYRINIVFFRIREKRYLEFRIFYFFIQNWRVLEEWRVE